MTMGGKEMSSVENCKGKCLHVRTETREYAG